MEYLEMKLTKQKLKQIIKEELAKVLEAHGGAKGPFPGRCGDAHKKDVPEPADTQQPADETHEEREDEPVTIKLPKYDPETRKRFHRQQSQKRDLARHIKGRKRRALNRGSKKWEL